MKINLKIITLILIFLIFFTQSISAQIETYPNYPPWTPEGAMEFAYQAYEYVMETGDFSEFQKQSGKFTKGGMLDYRFVGIANCDTYTFIAHPWYPFIVGKNGLLTKLKDAKGDLFMMRLCRFADQNPEGSWIRYFHVIPHFKEIPENNRMTPLGNFSIKIGSTPYVLGVVGREIDLPEKELNAKAKEWLATKRRITKRKKIGTESFNRKLDSSAKKAEVMAKKIFDATKTTKK